MKLIGYILNGAFTCATCDKKAAEAIGDPDELSKPTAVDESVILRHFESRPATHPRVEAVEYALSGDVFGNVTNPAMFPKERR